MTIQRPKRYLLPGILFLLALLTRSQLWGADNITISGKISSINGEPVAGAEVYLYSSGNIRKPADFISPKTDRGGYYRMVVPRAIYRAVARVKKGERYGPLMPGDRHSGEPVKIVPEEETELSLDFTVADMQELAQRREKDREELAVISGTATSAGKGIAGVYVYAKTGKTAATLPDYFSAWTDATGHYSLKLPSGSYFLGLATEFPPAESTAGLQEVTVSAEKLPVAIDLQLPLQ